ncbi:MAG: DUF881 domain-containing protein [Patescibacteria group bacterium]
MKNIKLMLFFCISVVIGFLVARHFTAFRGVESLVLREQSRDIVNEVRILKSTSDGLRSTITALQQKKADLSSSASSLQALEQEKKQYELLSGEIAVFGPGISIYIAKSTQVFWFTDLLNELVTSGAEAVSVNDIRITATTAGFRILPAGALLIGKEVTYAPFVIEAIGDSSTLYSSMVQPDGFVDRIEKTVKDLTIILVRKEKIIMDGVQPKE